MTEIETLECRIYMAEDEMYKASSELNRELHDLEHEIHALHARIEELVCRSGRVPAEAKALEVVGRVRSMTEEIDLGRIEEGARRVTEVKRRIEGYEREMAVQRHPSARLRAVA
jgi:phage shock protein A